MRQITDDLYNVELQVEGMPPCVVNVYLMGGVIIDAAIRQLSDQIVAAVQDHEVTAHAITHAHMDHQGGTHDICTALGIPFWCPAEEADYMERGDLLPCVPDNEVNRQSILDYAGPAHPVARRLRDGDEVGGFTVVETPGHSPGHISFWREADGVLVVGDTLFNRNPANFEDGLIEAPAEFTVDVERNRQSIRRLAALEPQLLCFGHGYELTDPTPFHRLVARLAEAVNA